MCFSRVARKILEVWNLNIAEISVHNNDYTMMMVRIAETMNISWNFKYSYIDDCFVMIILSISSR